MSTRLSGVLLLIVAVAGCGSKDAEYFADNPSEIRKLDQACRMAGDQADEDECAAAKEGWKLYESKLKVVAEEYLEDKELLMKVTKVCDDKILSGEVLHQDAWLDFECGSILALGQLREARAAERLFGKKIDGGGLTTKERTRGDFKKQD